jgi:sugar O-acyltransferase (sialic acid O-acetyltransferase NeuD family)
MGVREDIIIVGSGGLGREIASLFLHQDLKEQYNFLGFVDDYKDKESIVNGQKVLGGIEWLLKEKPCTHIIIGFSHLQRKLHLINRLQDQSIIFPTIIHPDAILIDPDHIKIGNGSIIFPYAILTTNITIGKNVIVHIGAKIHHDTIIHDNCILMPNVAITGGATIGNNVFLGTGAICPTAIVIPDNSVMQAGSVLMT